MNLTRCERGHFYDADRFKDCPRCGDSGISTMENKMYFGSREKADSVFESMAKAIRGNDYLLYISTAQELYKDVYIRKCKIRMSTEQIKASMRSRYGDPFTDPEKIDEAVDIAMAFIYEYDPEIESDDKAQAVLDNMVREEAEKNAAAGIKNRITDDWGLTPRNPVFVMGFPGMHYYINRLMTNNGEPVHVSRLGSSSVPGINGHVDRYEVTGPGIRMGIFISIYGNETPQMAPRGLKYRGAQH